MQEEFILTKLCWQFIKRFHIAGDTLARKTECGNQSHRKMDKRGQIKSLRLEHHQSAVLVWYINTAVEMKKLIISESLGWLAFYLLSMILKGRCLAKLCHTNSLHSHTQCNTALFLKFSTFQELFFELSSHFTSHRSHHQIPHPLKYYGMFIHGKLGELLWRMKTFPYTCMYTLYFIMYHRV